jgi:hypothetical protein
MILRPATLHTVIDKVFIDSGPSCSLSIRDHFSLKFDEYICAPVVGLFFWSSPAAVVLTIPKRIVNSVKSFSFWARTHILEKSCKAIRPLWADCNTNCSISFVSIGPNIVTALPHALPRYVGWRRFFIRIVSMGLIQNLEPTRLGAKLSPSFRFFSHRNTAQECRATNSTGAGYLRHKSPQSMVNNHCWMPRSKVIDVLRSAAKPIWALELYLS